ncbi:DEAD/DEAH box helicase [Streptomyces europaeiscabiei]|uniref:DEAD/DEAH box helicase n=1 Tax=Streptomyces europaeiscabiei TaxID=146819 RepID=UPI0029BCC385|nr:Helicase associated domain protein [Streptomyces europaeiscabiei]MDX2530797.1 Helicase associated domain protein [Streptomyces europaeiscabiei]
MPRKQRLRPHQVEAVDAVVRALGSSVSGELPDAAVRAQVIAPPGAGKSLIAVFAAQGLRAERVLVLVPTLDLLGQMVGVWRAGGRGGRLFGVCSEREKAAVGVRCTTDAGELAGWLTGAGRVTVFATYAAAGLGVLERAHAAGTGRWDLMVVDEAHRTAGVLGKPWAVVHDDRRLPAVRRLYMTATPRLWEVPGLEGAAGGAGQLVASMDDEEIFGPVVYRLTMSEAIERGLIAQYQVVCVDIADPQLSAVRLVGAEAFTDEVRGVRLAALQTAVLKTAAEHRLRRVLTFHHRTSEAEAFAGGLGRVASALWEADAGSFAEPGAVWADWLCGEHRAVHRRQVLETFSAGVVEDAVMELCVLSSARVLGEGVDTAECDAVVFVDARGSTPDVVQAVGRALRMQPGEGKVASLVVPVFLEPGEEPDEMLASRSYTHLVKVLTALRAHDAEAVEQLAVPQSPGRKTGSSAGGAAGGVVSAAAQGLLRFSTARDPVQLAAFIRARVLRPEGEYWRRGLQAAMAYAVDQGHLRVPYGYTAPDGFALGVWIARQRVAYRQGTLAEERVRELDAAGMVWSHLEMAFSEGLAAARGWAGEHGHLLAPTEATWQGYPVGIWLRDQRAAARRERAAQNGPGGGRASGRPNSARRWRELEMIDPAWCPAWDIAWQRCFHLARAHVNGGGELPAAPGEIVVQGEDLGRWAGVQRTVAVWDGLLPAQQWLLTEVLHLMPDPEQPQTGSAAGEQRAVSRTRAQMWAGNLAAARQYYQREGHLNVPRQHVETVDGEDRALGVFIANCRARKQRLAPERVQELTVVGMKWA